VAVKIEMRTVTFLDLQCKVFLRASERHVGRRETDRSLPPACATFLLGFVLDTADGGGTLLLNVDMFRQASAVPVQPSAPCPPELQP
jgi:hypothetical protein